MVKARLGMSEVLEPRPDLVVFIRCVMGLDSWLRARALDQKMRDKTIVEVSQVENALF
jgi:hypothetical protein